MPATTGMTRAISFDARRRTARGCVGLRHHIYSAPLHVDKTRNHTQSGQDMRGAHYIKNITMMVLLQAALLAALLPTSSAVASAHPASCAANYQAARIVQSAEPQYPAIAKLDGITGKSLIRVDLSETGRVVGASVATSSGSSILDRAAVKTVTSMSFAPETQSCNAVSGSYAVEVEFAG